MTGAAARGDVPAVAAVAPAAVAPAAAAAGTSAAPARTPAVAPGAPASAARPLTRAARCDASDLRPRFARCRAARAADSCRAAGGTWGPQGTATVPSCACPTGQGGCPCRRESDCLAGCRAPMALNASRANRCRALWSSCAPTSPALGCWCWFGEDGVPVERCSP